MRRVKIGVPQGLILEPLLFLIYINDFPSISKSLKSLLYADDTAIFLESRNAGSLQLLVNRESKHICKWLQLNKLHLNTQKTVCQVYTKETTWPELSVHLNGITINEEKTVKYLGVYANSQLKWSSHIDHVSLLISKKYWHKNRFKYLLDKLSLLLLYNALFLPYVAYCCLFWDFTYPSYLHRVENVRKKECLELLIINIGYHILIPFSSPLTFWRWRISPSNKFWQWCIRNSLEAFPQKLGT